MKNWDELILKPVRFPLEEELADEVEEDRNLNNKYRYGELEEEEEE